MSDGGSVLTEKTIAVLATSGAALFVSALVVWTLQARMRRRFDAMLHRVDDHLRSVSDSLQDVLDRASGVTADAVRDHELTWDGLAGTHEALGYEAELEREVNRARMTRRPLALIVLGVHEFAGSEPIEGVATELLRLLGRVTRTGDTVVRRGDSQLVVLLPETTAEAAWRFYARLRAELEESFEHPDGKLRVLTDVVEWRPNESSTSFDDRAQRAAPRDSPLPVESTSNAQDIPGAR